MNSPTIHDQKSFNHAMKVFSWNKWLLSTLGLWPESPNNLIFSISFGYYVYHMILEYFDLFLFIDDLEHVIENLTENMTFTQILIRMVSLKKYNLRLGAVINEALKDYDVTIYKNSDETKAFISHMNRAQWLAKMMCIIVAMTASSYYMKPMMSPQSVEESDDMEKNATIQFILPYHFYIFYEMDDSKTYILTYASQFPFVSVSGLGQVSTDCLMVALVFHVSGRLAVLAIRITRMETKNPGICQMEMSNIIIEHNRLLKMSESVVEAFSEVILAQIVSATLLICILGFQLLSNFSKGQNADIPAFCIFLVTVLFASYLLCLMSESLISENHEVCLAYYNCKWYEMPVNTAKSLIICMARSQEPLGLTLGKFGVLYFSALTIMAKTSIAYLSILRTFLSI